MTKAFKTLIALKSEDLVKKKAELEKELVKVRGQASTGAGQKNPYVIRNHKKTIARILTLLNQQSANKQEIITKTKTVNTKHE